MRTWATSGRVNSTGGTSPAPSISRTFVPDRKTRSSGPCGHDFVLAMEPQTALQHVVDVLNDTNKYIGDRAPWKQVKEDLNAAGETLTACLEVLRVSAILLSPVMPEKCASILGTIGWEKAPAFADAKEPIAIPAGTPVKKAEPLFPRVEWRKE